MLSSGRNEKCPRWKYASPRRYHASTSSGYRATKPCSIVIASGRHSLRAALGLSTSASRGGRRPENRSAAESTAVGSGKCGELVQPVAAERRYHARANVESAATARLNSASAWRGWARRKNRSPTRKALSAASEVVVARPRSNAGRAAESWTSPARSSNKV